jgi:pilus assembly protein CpaF
VNIRKFVVRVARLPDLVALGSLTDQAASFLDASVRAGLNIVVTGGTQPAKRPCSTALAASIPGRDRVVSVERSSGCASPIGVNQRAMQAAPRGRGRQVGAFSPVGSRWAR